MISLKKIFHHSQLGALKKSPGALGTCPVCPLVTTTLQRQQKAVLVQTMLFSMSATRMTSRIPSVDRLVQPKNDLGVFVCS